METFEFYGIKKKGSYLRQYNKKRASWVASPDVAWMTRDKEMALFFARLTKGKAIRFTISEEPVTEGTENEM